MAVELDTLEIRIEASANGAASALDKLTASLKNVKKAMTGMSGKEKPVEDMKKSAESAEEAVKKEESAVSNAEKATEKLTQTQNKAAGSGKKFSMSLADITKATGKVQSGISGIFNGLKTGNASSLLGGFSSLKSVFSEMKIGGGDGGSGTTAAAEGATRAGEAFAKMSGEAGKAGDAAGEAGEIAGASAGGWQAVAIAVGVKVVTALGKAFLAFQKLKANIIIAPFKALAEHAGRAAGKVGQLFSSLKRIATYRLLRTALKEIGEGFSTGLENAYYFSQVTGGLLSKSLDSISTEILYLKNSVGAAVAPLINALAPAVEFVVDKFVGLVNVVNQFLSALGVTGKWIKAIKYPTKYGDALDDATGSAKELKRTILGIDEINPLDGDNASGKGKSGLTASDYSSMFEYATVDPQISDFAAKIKEMVENGKWTEVGQTLAAKINNLIKIADEKIKWENVGDKITTWLTNITDAFNGFVRDFDGTGLGNLVGDAIMTAVNTIDTAVNPTDFETLGDKITDFINGALDTIDGEKIGKTIHDTVKKVLNLATQVLNGVDKGKLSEDVSGFFTGLDLADLIASFKETFTALGKSLRPLAVNVASEIGDAFMDALWADFGKNRDEYQKDFVIGYSISGPTWKDVFGDLESFWVDLSYNFEKGWNDFVDQIIEMTSKSPLTSWIGDLLGNTKFKGLENVENEAAKIKSIYDKFEGIFNTFNGAGLNASKGFETGLNTDKTVGKAFGDNVNKNVDGEGNGKRGGNAYRGGLFGTLSIKPNTEEVSQGNSLFSKILNALGFTNGGKDGGTEYKRGFFGKLADKLSGNETTDGNGFFDKIKAALGFKTGGSEGASDYRTSFFDKLKEKIGTKGRIFGESVSENVKTSANGAGTSSSFRTSFFDKLKEKIGTKGRIFGEAVSGNVKSSADGTGTSEDFRTSFFDKLKSSIGTKGRLFGEAVSDNVKASSNGEGTASSFRSNFFARLRDSYTGDAGSTFMEKVKNALNPENKGTDASSNYRTGFFARLRESYTGNAGSTFMEKVRKAILPKTNGGTSGDSYKTGFDNSLKQYDGNGGDNFGKTISKNVNDGANPTNTGKTLGSNFSSALDYIAVLFAGGKTFGEKISSNILASGDGNGTAKTYRTGFLGLLDSVTSGGQKLAGFIKDNIIGNSSNPNGKQTATSFRLSFLNLLDSNTSGGTGFGENIGKNIATGIKAGIKSKTLSIDYNVSVNGGAPSTFPVKVTLLPYAGGGIVDAGQMFIAQEAGPELIGNIGRKTAVANTTQMVDAMAQGVYQANAESNMLLRQLIDYAAEIAAKEYESGGNVTVESITQAMTRNNRRLGKTVVAVG